MLGYVIHLSQPRHWVALVPPGDAAGADVAALLCDSLYPHVYALTVHEVADLFLAMGVYHLQAGESQLSSFEQQQMAAEWCAYSVDSMS